MFDPKKIKKDFPILNQKINGKPLVYLDNAATTQKPKSVIQSITKYYETTNANVHRGIHELSEQATEAYENARKTVADFINAKSEKEIIFTRNATEAINLVAKTWGAVNIKKDDEIIVSELEHHSNLIPWQQLAKAKNAKLKIIPIKKDSTLDYSKYKKLLSAKTKLVAITACSNVLGTIIDTKKITKLAHKAGAKTLIDAAQSTAHMPTDVQEIDCDFLALSSHKMLGPTGIGVLYTKQEILEEIPPFLFGGDMIHVVHQHKSTFSELPWKFEAGTPNIAGAIAFAEAIKYLKKLRMKNILKHDQELLKYAREKFSKHKQVRIYGPKDIKKSSGILSFTVKGAHPHDIASIFNTEGIAIRAGHHCAQPLMKSLKIPATARLSFYMYNTKKDIDAAEKALQKVFKTFKI